MRAWKRRKPDERGWKGSEFSAEFHLAAGEATHAKYKIDSFFAGGKGGIIAITTRYTFYSYVIPLEIPGFVACVTVKIRASLTIRVQCPSETCTLYLSLAFSLRSSAVVNARLNLDTLGGELALKLTAGIRWVKKENSSSRHIEVPEIHPEIRPFL